ncbi:MAG: hypothetical protein KDB27_33295, partial [Planctomycetales bacterium]|nr:hypothetical protein [Planctomycetales bacterium]
MFGLAIPAATTTLKLSLENRLRRHSSKIRTCLSLVMLLIAARNALPQGTGELELRVVDADTKEPIAVRMQLRNRRGVLITPSAATKIGRQFCFDGEILLQLSVGQYTFTMERGPEYRTRTGSFEISRSAEDNKTVEMLRFVDMANEGWYSGDLDVDHPAKQLKLFMLAEDLRIAAARGWPETRDTQQTPDVAPLGNQGFCAHDVAADDRQIGRVNFCLLKSVIPVTRDADDTESPFSFMRYAKQQQAHVDLTTLTHADLPTWIASQQLHSVGLLNSNVRHPLATAASTIGRVPDRTIYAPPLGDGRWAVTSYYE